MTTNSAHRTEPAVERYLERVRAALRGLPVSDAEDILLELRGHIAERATSAPDVDGVLESLGDPTALARQYLDENAIARAECSHSPLAILHSLVLLRRGSLGGWIVLGLAALGYAWAIALGAAAVEKLISPRDVGLWLSPGAFVPRLMVDGPGPAGSRELLGGWFSLVAAATFAGLLLTTNSAGRWWIRRRR